MIQFANALKMLPTIIAENAGLDSNDLITRLQAAHFTSTEKRCYVGLDVNAGDINEDVVKNLGITESAKVKRCVVSYAAEAAEMILRVDDVVSGVSVKDDRTQKKAAPAGAEDGGDIGPVQEQ
eukprot:TRINITY_DN16478_c0_g1_i1.p1 TRINITY_DN16478_c0_g1~~TRINITY_DN16478_c0_g1_i1.p1  ORF type:complete len:123 (+),score=56.80 TRINITY_DN16478_c0_g1_i1:77-445(+)